MLWMPYSLLCNSCGSPALSRPRCVPRFHWIWKRTGGFRVERLGCQSSQRERGSGILARILWPRSGLESPNCDVNDCQGWLPLVFILLFDGPSVNANCRAASDKA